MIGIQDCVKNYAVKTGCTNAEAEKAMKTAVEVLKDAIIEDGGFSFIGLFSVKVAKREARNGRNPKTGLTHVIPAHKTLKVTVGKQLKEELNK